MDLGFVINGIENGGGRTTAISEAEALAKPVSGVAAKAVANTGG